MQRKSFTLSALLVLSLFGTLLLSACGGGGGGSSIPAEYTGSTEPATVTSSNAETLVLDAYESGGQADGLAVVPLADSDSHVSPSIDRVSSLLEKVALSLAPDLTGDPTVSTMASDPPVAGTCGGSYVVTLNQGSNSASGSILFNGYCEGGVTINGGISFSGTGDGNGNVSVTMTFGNLTSSESGQAFSLHGSITMNFNSISESGTMTLRMVFADLSNQETLFVNYTVGVTTGSGYEDVTISGRFYAHHHGYLQISTDTPLRTLDGEFEPSSGKLRFDGAGGTWAIYEVTGPGTYTITYFDGSVEDTIIGPTP